MRPGRYLQPRCAVCCKRCEIVTGEMIECDAVLFDSHRTQHLQRWSQICLKKASTLYSSVVAGHITCEVVDTRRYTLLASVRKHADAFVGSVWFKKWMFLYIYFLSHFVSSTWHSHCGVVIGGSAFWTSERKQDNEIPQPY